METILEERYGKKADAEIRLDPSERVLTACPVGTGKNKYDDIAVCVIAVLQVQADHHVKEKALNN